MLFYLLVAGDTWAQTAPGAPTITTVTAGSSSSLGLTLVVTWTAPADTGGSAIEAYDVRFIKTAADETDDANWTVVEKAWESGDGTLSYIISGLTDSTEYDVQVRAVNESDAGDWSTSVIGTTSDHSDTISGATSLPLDTAMGGVIDPGTDVDYFTFRLSRETGMFIWTTGDLDTVGELQNSSGTVIDSDDDGPLSSAPLNFFMWQTLAAGTYRIKVSSYGEATGSYVLRTRTMVDTSSISDAQEIIFDSDGNGFTNGLIDPGGDTDYFTFTLSETTDLVIHTTTGLVGDTVGTLLNSDGTEILASNDDGYLLPSRFQFLIREQLDAGTYYIAVEGFDPDEDTGFYNLHVNKVTEPGNTRATATPLILGKAGGGSIDPSTDEDYFRLVVPEETHIFVGAVSETVNIDGELLDENGNSVPTFPHDISFGDGPYIFFLYDHLAAGTYYIKVTHDGDDTGPYTIRAFENGRYNRFLDRCSNIDRPSTVNDPQYGCQWHLNNEGQLKDGTSDEDINVEEVWDDNNLGSGINVAVVDDGMDYTHEDLSANVIAARNHDYTAGEGEGTRPTYFTPLKTTARRWRDSSRRGITAWACGVSRPGRRSTATISSWIPPMQTKPTPRNATWRRTSPTIVGGLTTGPDWTPLPASGRWRWRKVSRKGSDDKGIFYVWAAGNGALRGDNSNFDGYANHYGVTAACAVNDQGQRSAYSEEGANLWVCAPSRRPHPRPPRDHHYRQRRLL